MTDNLNDQSSAQPSREQMLADISKMPLEALRSGAVDLGIGLPADGTREEWETLFVDTILGRRAAAEKAAQDDLARQAERDRLDEFYKTKEGKKHKRAVDDRARNDAVRAVHFDFASALPSQARSTGAFDVPEDHATAVQPAVPSGAYRVLGADWVHRFKDGRWVSSSRSHALSRPDWTDIPNSEPPLAAPNLDG